MTATALQTPLLDSRPWHLWVVPHTHWDREWYLQFEDFRIRLAEVVDEAIATLEARPEYHFTLDRQTVLLEDYLEIRPEMEGRVRALLADGRLETGPSYVLPDEFLLESRGVEIARGDMPRQHRRGQYAGAVDHDRDRRRRAARARPRGRRGAHRARIRADRTRQPGGHPGS